MEAATDEVWYPACVRDCDDALNNWRTRDRVVAVGADDALCEPPPPPHPVRAIARTARDTAVNRRLLIVAFPSILPFISGHDNRKALGWQAGGALWKGAFSE